MKAFISKLKSKLRSITAKKAFRAFSFFLIIFLPLIFAFFVYSAYEDIDMHKDSEKISVILLDSNGNEVATDTGHPEYMNSDSLIVIVNSLIKNKVSIQAPSSATESSLPLTVIISKNDIEEKFTLHFSFSKSGSYCLNEKGEYFELRYEDCEKFLSSPYSECVYREALVPALMGGTDIYILPSQVEWSYKTVSGDFVNANRNKSTPQGKIYNLTNTLSLNFEISPDICDVKIYDFDKIVYEGDLEDIDSLSVPSNAKLRAVISAEWTASSNNHFHGKAEYDFEVRLRANPTFSINSSTVSPGEFIIIKCENAAVLPEIISSSFEDPSKYKFVLEKESAKCLIPIPLSYEGEKIEFTVKCGSTQKKFSVKINQSASLSTPFFIEENGEYISSLMTDNSYSEFEAISKTVSALKGNTVYYRESFVDPLSDTNNYAKGYSFAQNVLTSSKDFPSYRSNGIEIISKRSHVVSALNNGKVIYSGQCTLLGNFLVVDHGLGVLTWYGHLSDFDVSVGDTVIKGQQIGKIGDGGISSAEGFLLMTSIHDVFVNPTLILGKTF